MLIHVVSAGPSTTDWISASVGVAVLVVATIGFVVTIITLIAARDRQRLEIEGYVRVDIGPPDGTDDYEPPSSIAFIDRGQLETVGTTSEDSPVISVWYRNLQTHPLGVALGIASRIGIALVDAENEIHEISQTHDIAYLEPGKAVRIDAVRFPQSWDALCHLEAIEYRNLHWDGAIPRHGRQECLYIDGRFEMTPLSDPTTVWRDRWAKLIHPWRPGQVPVGAPGDEE